MTDPDLFCRYEGEEFPAEQFKPDPEWGLVHEVEPRHTIFGDDIDDDDWVILTPSAPPPTREERIFFGMGLSLLAVAIAAIIYFSVIAR